MLFFEMVSQVFMYTDFFFSLFQESSSPVLQLVDFEGHMRWSVVSL